MPTATKSFDGVSTSDCLARLRVNRVMFYVLVAVMGWFLVMVYRASAVSTDAIERTVGVSAEFNSHSAAQEQEMKSVHESLRRIEESQDRFEMMMLEMIRNGKHKSP